MEGVLDFNRGRQKLVIILRGVRGGGGGNRCRPAPLIMFIGGGGVRGVGQGGKREQICPCTKCSHVHVDYTLSLLLISPYLCSAIKKFHRNALVPLKRV
jgi:hypothetical protein